MAIVTVCIKDSHECTFFYVKDKNIFIEKLRTYIPTVWLGVPNVSVLMHPPYSAYHLRKWFSCLCVRMYMVVCVPSLCKA